MEVTTVSPPPASPTEEADLCEIDVTNVAIHSVTLLMGLCGLAGNGAGLWRLSLDGIAFFIFFLAVADFLFLLFAVPSALLFLVEDVSCSPIMPLVYLSFILQLSMVSCYWGLFLWILSDIENALLFKLCCRWDLPERLGWMLGLAMFWTFFTVFTVIPTVTSTCPLDEQEHCRAALISIFVIILLLFAAPLILNYTIHFIKAMCGSKKKQPEKLEIVIFLMVLFTLLLSLCNFLQQLGYIVVSTPVFFLLTCINSTIKPFIYFLVGSCWRHFSVRRRKSLRRVFEEPEENTASNDAPRDTVI